MGTWTVSCESCDHSWKLMGAWSVYEREAVESRPCPCCGAYTLSGPEPQPQPMTRRGTRPAATAGARQAG